jgi:hypothetical protein
MTKNSLWRCDDEPPSKIQTPEIANHSNWSLNHTLGHLHRLLLWRGTLHHKSGGLMCIGSDFPVRWLHLVLGDGKYEG